MESLRLFDSYYRLSVYRDFENEGLCKNQPKGTTDLFPKIKIVSTCQTFRLNCSDSFPSLDF